MHGHHPKTKRAKIPQGNTLINSIIGGRDVLIPAPKEPNVAKAVLSLKSFRGPNALRPLDTLRQPCQPAMWRLLAAIVAIAQLFAVSLGSDACYANNGTQVNTTNSKKCTFNGITIMCCGPHDTCLENGLCKLNTKTPTYWRDTCAYSNWTEAGCLNMCTVCVEARAFVEPQSKISWDLTNYCFRAMESTPS